MKHYIIAALMVSLVFAGCTQTTDVYEQCEALGGEALEEFSECEGISQQACEDLGGEFLECESACRNNPEAEICTLQCVAVCSFE